MAESEFVAVVNDTNPSSNGKAYSLTISGNNHSQLLGKKIGDVVDGIFVGSFALGTSTVAIGSQTDRLGRRRVGVDVSSSHTQIPSFGFEILQLFGIGRSGHQFVSCKAQ